MILDERERVAQLILAGDSPEAVFGPLKGTAQEQFEAARSIFRALAKTVHPDSQHAPSDHPGPDLAFKKLSLLWEQAQERIASETYGSSSSRPSEQKSFQIRSKTHTYTLEKLLFRGDLCLLYRCSSASSSGKPARLLAKVALSPGDNDLVQNEALLLTHLEGCPAYDTVRHFLPSLRETFGYHEQASGAIRQVNLLSYASGLFSLQEVKEAYPSGIDPKDMAWMLRRLLVVLAFAHDNGIIHGCVLPPHILIHPEQHGVVLIDWSYAVLDPLRNSQPLGAICSAYRNWYPSEVFARKPPTPALDLFMAARCMLELLGGDPISLSFPRSVPWPLQSFLQGCLLPEPHMRPQNAHLLLREFDSLLERLWGPRTFHPFTMPSPALS